MANGVGLSEFSTLPEVFDDAAWTVCDWQSATNPLRVAAWAISVECVRPQLQAVVEEAYRVFGHYRVGGSLTVCNCDVCVSIEDEHRLLTTPLREIPAALLSEYSDSAHDWDEGQVADEFRYFLPRYLELVALNDPPDVGGIPSCLWRMGRSTWRETWPRDERNVIQRFFDAFMVASLQRLRLVHCPLGWELEFNLAEVLTMVVRAGGDIDRVLAAWDAADDPPAAIQMAALRSRVGRTSEGPYFYSPYLEDDHKQEAHRVGDFLTRPEVVPRIEAAFFKIEDPRLQQLVSNGIK